MQSLARLTKAFLSICCLLLQVSLLSAQDQPDAGEYRLAPGDSIQVKVYGEDDLSLELNVPANGRVDYAFVGEVELAGKTVRELQQDIIQLLKGDFLIDPKVSVSVVSYRNAYVYGAVNRPGGYTWEPGLTVRKLITLAGGLKERASGSKWFLVPEGGNEASRQRVNEDDPINPGDSLTVEESFF